MAIINYEELVAEYNESLANVLRGFRPKFDFLELWVPDSDVIGSIINLVESAQTYGVSSVTLSIKKETLADVNMEELNSELSEMGNVNVKDGNPIQLEVSSLVEESKVRESKDLAELSKEIPEAYAEKIALLSKNNKYEGSVQEDDHLLVIRSHFEGTSLFVGMDTEHHMMRKVAYSGASTDVKRALLEGLCEIIEGTPVQDASDHAVLRLEWMLRDHSKKLAAKGITNVFNIDEMFKLPQNLIREIRETYEEKTGYKDTTNFWDGRVTTAWKEASVEDRIRKIKVALEEVLPALKIDGNDVEVMGIEKGIKVNLAFSEEILSKEKAALIMKLEVLLRNSVEPKLELYQEAWVDRNKSRRL